MKSANRSFAATEQGDCKMQDIYVVGVGMTPFGKFRDKTIKDMTG